MGVVRVVCSTRTVGGASVRMGRSNVEHVFVYMISVQVVQMSATQIVGMSGVRDRYGAAPRVMLVRVRLMFHTSAHCDLLLKCDGRQSNSTSAG